MHYWKDAWRIDVRWGISSLTTSLLCQSSNNQGRQLGQWCHYTEHYWRSFVFHLFSVNVAYHLHKVLSNLGTNLHWSEPNSPTIKLAVGGHDLVLWWLLLDFLLKLVFHFLIVCLSSHLFSAPLFSSSLQSFTVFSSSFSFILSHELQPQPGLKRCSCPASATL